MMTGNLIRNNYNFVWSQVDQEQTDKIMSYIKSGKEQGAKLVAGGNKMGDKGYFIEPTVFADVKDEMKIAQEEVNLNKINMYFPEYHKSCLDSQDLTF